MAGVHTFRHLIKPFSCGWIFFLPLGWVLAFALTGCGTVNRIADYILKDEHPVTSSTVEQEVPDETDEEFSGVDEDAILGEKEEESAISETFSEAIVIAPQIKGQSETPQIEAVSFIDETILEGLEMLENNPSETGSTEIIDTSSVEHVEVPMGDDAASEAFTEAVQLGVDEAVEATTEEVAPDALVGVTATALGEFDPGLQQQSVVITEKLEAAIVGGRGGSGFKDTPDAFARLSKIKIRSGWWIDSIQVVWKLPDGSQQESEQRGGAGGSLEEFVLDADEYLTSITGKCGKYVGSITFHTNKRTSRTYGLGKGAGAGKTFKLTAPEGTAIKGFVGRSGMYLDALGIVTSPVDEPLR